jgi:26S proteasome regulatory subunit N8
MESNLPQNEVEPIGVKVHPIALLSVVDHFERTVGNKKNKRAVGVLLGENNHGVYEITNSYAIPYDEDTSTNGVFFVDHNYHETMFNMFKKINIKEKVLGWYVTGSTYKDHDIEINEVWARYTPNPVLITLDVRSVKEFELPTKAFYSVRVLNDKGLVIRNFKSLPCSVSAYEAEEVGVEHLVREIRDLDMDSLKTKLSNKVTSLLALEKKLKTIINYLDDVLEGRRKQDKQINLTLHEIMSRLPKLMSEEFRQIMSMRMNDNYLSIYVTSLVKGVISIHQLLNNRIKAIEEREKSKLIKNEVKDKVVKEAVVEAKTA